MMKEYTKINTFYKRERVGRDNPIIEGDWSTPEIAYLSTNEWIWTEKVNGTNMRVSWEWDGTRGKIHYGGRTDDASIHMGLLAHLDDTFREDDRLESVFGDGKYILMGEGYGPGVVKGSGNYSPKEHHFVLFDVLANTEDWGWIYLERDNVVDIAKNLGIGVVPIISRGTLPQAAKAVQDGLQSTWGNFEAEGLVCRPTVEMRTRRGERIITKIKAEDYRILAKCRTSSMQPAQP
jgi:hypothetical protein